MSARAGSAPGAPVAADVQLGRVADTDLQAGEARREVVDAVRRPATVGVMVVAIVRPYALLLAMTDALAQLWLCWMAPQPINADGVP